MLKAFILLLLVVGIAECLKLEPIDFVDVESFDGVRSYPVLKATYRPQNSKKSKGELKAIKSEKLNNKKREEVTDNVREFEPQSRAEIKKLKKLTFHGRAPPKNLTARSDVAKIPPIQMDYLQRKYNQQRQANARAKPTVKAKNHDAVSRSRKSTNKNSEKGFQPLMKPSPIHLYPADPPTFAATRNHVDYLKKRQQEFFSELERTTPIEKESTTGEIEYFVKRERELADEQRPKVIPKPNDHVEILNNDDESENDDEDQNEAFRDSGRNEAEEESRRYENFVPFRLYAQVRHVEAESHEPKYSAPDPKVTQRLSLEKKNVYYKEEGYDEKDYDHGAEQVASHYRVKRDTQENKLPVAMALINKSELKNLSGEKLLKHLDELLKNTTLYLPDDDDVIGITKRSHPSKTIYGSNAPNYKSHKYPYYNLPDTTLNTMSAFRYSENMKNFPKDKESLYSFKNVNDCAEIDEEPSPVPTDIEVKGKRTSYNEKPQRLRKLGDKINCYKDKYFGKDPFDNPLFKEKYVAAAIPIPLKESSFIHHQANPLITVYDDVINNIRAAFAKELQEKKDNENREKASNVPPEPISASNSVLNTVQPEDMGSLPVVTRLPIFDINNYYPKLQVPNFDDETKSQQIKADFEVEIIEAPSKKLTTRDTFQNSYGNDRPRDVIQILKPPNLSQEKRWRRNPPSKNIPPSRNFSHHFKPTQDKYKLRLL